MHNPGDEGEDDDDLVSTRSQKIVFIENLIDPWLKEVDGVEWLG